MKKYHFFFVLICFLFLNCNSEKDLETTFIKNNNKNYAAPGIPKKDIATQKVLQKNDNVADHFYDKLPIESNFVDVNKIVQKKIDSVIGNWENGDRSINFSDDGSGISILDKSYGGNNYSYCRQFEWRQKDSKIQVVFSSEVTVRNGFELVREKELSEKATYLISENKLKINKVTFQRK